MCPPAFLCRWAADKYMLCLLLPGKTCQQADPCASNPCANGGQCVPFDSSYVCKCTLGFHGANCKEDVNECSRTPPICKNGGTCINEIGSFQCSCRQAYTGQTCEQLYVPCYPSPCQNGGTCRQTGDTTHECSCLPGTLSSLVRAGFCTLGRCGCCFWALFSFPSSCLGIGIVQGQKLLSTLNS